LAFQRTGFMGPHLCRSIEETYYRVTLLTALPAHVRRQFRRYPLFCALIVFCTLCVAKSFAVSAATAPLDSFVRISDDEGLAHSDVRAIAQDHQGFIWFGLRLAGLTRYDGYELKVHQHDAANPRSIGNRVIWSLLVDRTGTLWIGTEGGLDRYDRATDSFIHHVHDASRPDSIANNTVTCLFEDAAGTIWAGTRDGLCRLDNRETGAFTTFRRPQVLKGSATKDTFRSIIEDTTTGLLWLGSSDGLAAFDRRTGAFATFLHDPANPESLSHNAVNKVIRDEEGVFWAFTESGINSFKTTLTSIPAHMVGQPSTSFKRYLQPTGVTTPGINFVRDGLVDRKKRLWLASRGGVHLFDRATGKFTPYRRKPADPTSLSDDFTQTIFEDRSGNLWVGTYAGGVNRLRSEAKPFEVHRHQPGNPRSISEDRISGLAFDPQGRLWAATVNGLNRYEGDRRWTRFMHDPADPDSLRSDDLSTLAAAPNGDLWIGTAYDGVYRYDHRRFHTHPTSPSSAPEPNGTYPFTGVQVNSILPDDKGGAWIGARAYGLDYFSEGKFLHFGPREASANSLAQPTTNAVLGRIASDGSLWFATETSGLVRLDLTTQRFTTFAPPSEHRGTAHSLHCFATAADGSIWLGAADGLLQFDPATQRFVRQISAAQGLPHPAVMTIVPDRRGHLWVGTANGLADFDPVTEKVRVYEKPDGLPSNVFSQRTGALGPDGRVYLGTRAGLVAFAPEELRDNPTPPPVVLTELRWLGDSRARSGGSYTASVLNIGETLRVPPGQLGFSLRFSALDFTAPEKNRFRYRLEGLDVDWSSTTSRDRNATYTSLPPGEYLFRVQASNADQVWNEEGASLKIVVEPQIWQTAWFRVGLALLGVALVASGIQWRLRSIRRRNALLEEQVSLRTSQLKEEVVVRQRAEAALRESHTDLERRVQERTSELAQSNKNLQAEITGRKSIEAQLRQSQKMEAIGQLAGGIAHDFNNLLTVILGQSELLGDADMAPEARDAAVRDINSAAQRATNLTRQLLVFSRHQSMNPVAVDLNGVVSGVSKLLRHVIGEHIAFETNFAPGTMGVLADPGMLEQVLLNMAVNARDAMPRGGRLTISTTHATITPAQARPETPNAKPGAYARFSVSDTGGGIPPEVLPQIFEPFFTTKEAGKGTGLGLAISLGIVQQHRGWIDVETHPGKGTTFHVYLPSHSLVSPLPPARRTVAPFTPGNTTILLAEDETAVRSVVQRVLSRQGYRVIEASSGADALAKWAVHRDEVSILLTDIVMPGWPDGRELAERLLQEKPSLHIITMSGYDPGEFEAQKSAGSNFARPHIRKPFTAEDLLRALERSLHE
jgi:signal transduction histidine kinase/ligand-binding sensor domain-containing protein/CheY-like chemotaxis protein